MLEKFMIGDLAKQTDCKVQTIRYYEDIGLMPLAQRAENGRRVYNNLDMERLNFIRHSRDMGFSLDDIRNILALADQPDQPCEKVDKIARDHLKQVERKIASLTTLRSELVRILNECEGGTVLQCNVVHVLADHSLCEDHGKVSEPTT
ncbi:MerR family transcriptional regulator [Kordiimonas pumila]|uniref:Helix-turn-helix domain-containing protein n=1 Tax=Kordiimonas pumila TaxID=2161677 RepID=A0ABV7D691_9PROT|nr:helix-turn-helix domain-containing protein [Kordiimonas pumila]